MGFGSVTGNVSVRFACPKGFVETEGHVVNDTEVSLLTASFEKFGPMEVSHSEHKWFAPDVRVMKLLGEITGNIF